MIILLTILIILYALTSCKEKIQEKKGNEDNWKVYQQLEEKEEQNIQNPFIREETYFNRKREARTSKSIIKNSNSM